MPCVVRMPIVIHWTAEQQLYPQQRCHPIIHNPPINERKIWKQRSTAPVKRSHCHGSVYGKGEFTFYFSNFLFLYRRMMNWRTVQPRKKNGRISIVKNEHHFDIKYFFFKLLISKKVHLEIYFDKKSIETKVFRFLAAKITKIVKRD